MLPKPLYSWRIRENQTFDHAADRPDPWRSRAPGSRRRCRRWPSSRAHEQLEARRRPARPVPASHDLQFRITAAQHAGDEYWEVLRQGVQDLTERSTSRCGTQVSVQQRIAILLVHHGLRAETTWFTGLGRSNPKRVQRSRPRRPALSRHPGPAHPRRRADRPGARLRRSPARSDHARSVGCSGPTTAALRITAWAYVDNVSLADPETPFRGAGVGRARRQDRRARRDGAADRPPRADHDGHRRPPSTGTPTTSGRASRPRSTRRADRSHRPGSSSTWRDHGRGRAAGIRRSGPLAGPYRLVPPGPRRLVSVTGSRSRRGTGRESDLRIAVKPVRCVTRWRLSGRVLSVASPGPAGFVPFAIELAFPGGTGGTTDPAPRPGGQRRG